MSKKTVEEIHNQLVDIVENEKEYIKQLEIHKQSSSDYQRGYYAALCIFLKWIEESE
jgi:hypothetical protein